jgi:hypothetical protein
MVETTAYNLEMRLQRIDEKISILVADHPSLLEEASLDLQDEKAVTVQCLRICERASAYIKSLQDGQPTLQNDATENSAEPSAGHVLNQFEAQILTQETLNKSRDSLVETIGRLRERLASVVTNGGPDRQTDMLRLQEEINISKQCLQVCKEASDQVSSQKIHVIGDVTADEDSDGVVVTTLADLFKVGNVDSKGRSALLVGSMTGDELIQLSKDRLELAKYRYGNRFDALGSNLAGAQLDPAAATSSTHETRKMDTSAMRSNKAKEDRKLGGPGTTHDKPSSNEVRRRKAEGEDRP